MHGCVRCCWVSSAMSEGREADGRVLRRAVSGLFPGELRGPAKKSVKGDDDDEDDEQMLFSHEEVCGAILNVLRCVMSQHLDAVPGDHESIWRPVSPPPMAYSCSALAFGSGHSADMEG